MRSLVEASVAQSTSEKVLRDRASIGESATADVQVGAFAGTERRRVYGANRVGLMCLAAMKALALQRSKASAGTKASTEAGGGGVTAVGREDEEEHRRGSGGPCVA